MNYTVSFGLAEDIVDNEPRIGHKFLCNPSSLF
jgi:hypothetical protein